MATSGSNTLSRARALHPPLVHIPIGGIVIVAVCDVVSIAGGSSHRWAHTWFKGGSYALIVGTGTLVIALLTGIADRARQTRPGSTDRRAVNIHAVMVLVGVISIVDLILRNNHYKNAAHTPAIVLILTLVALALVFIGGELGGRLVYRRRIGVRALGSGDATDGDGAGMGSADQAQQLTRAQPAGN